MTDAPKRYARAFDVTRSMIEGRPMPEAPKAEPATAEPVEYADGGVWPLYDAPCIFRPTETIVAKGVYGISVQPVGDVSIHAGKTVDITIGAKPPCAECKGAGWVCSSQPLGVPHLVICDACLNPENHPCP